jgi:hypothetical protein
MNKQIIPKEVLIYFDGPQLFVGADQVGTRYICLLSESTERLARYLCSPISVERLSNFTLGNLDLLDIFIGPETGEVYTALVQDSSMAEIPVELIDITKIPAEWLPEKGFFFDKEDSSDELVVQESCEKNRGVVHLALNPPESRGEDCKIDAVTLSESVKRFQNLVKFAYKKSLLSTKPEFRKLHEAADNYELEIFKCSNGSFKVHMQSKLAADLSCNVELFRAMTKIDELMQAMGDPASAVEILKSNKGHLVGAFKKFLAFIVEKDIPLYYEWTTPHYGKGFRNDITRSNANYIYQLLVEIKELDKEQIEFVGEVTKIDIKAGLWTIVNEEDSKPYSGRVDEVSSVGISGITAGGVRYRFLCEERIEEETVSGKEKAHYFLISHAPA